MTDHTSQTFVIDANMIWPLIDLSITPEMLARRRIDPYRISRIAMAVATVHGVTVAEMRGSRKHKKVVRARWDAWAKIYETYEDITLPMIARWFFCDHTTVLAGIRRHRQILERAALAAAEVGDG